MILRLIPLLLLITTTFAGTNTPPARILLISIDGMHALDLARFTHDNPSSTLAQLSRTGVTYTEAACARPADSFPGMMAIATGGSPLSTGVYFDLSYDRSLWPPGITNGPTGTTVTYDETVDINPNVLDGGGGIEINRLPRDPSRAGAVVFPHNYLRVNTIFEVIKAAGYRTAWSDKHLADEMVQGPSGQGIDDLYLLEINGVNQFGTSITKSLDATKAFDDQKLLGILNQIKGLDHTGATNVGVPAIFGMNFQAISVAQRLSKNKTITGSTATGAAAGPGGYLDGGGTPSLLLSDALSHTDASIGSLITALQTNGLLSSTYVIITAKHGQAPIDPTKLNIVSPSLIPSLIDPSTAQLLFTGGDDAALLWLKDQSKTTAAANVLLTNQSLASIQDVLFGSSLTLRFPDPTIDPRVPDIIAIGKPGTIYTTASKIAEHGGFTDQDLNVPILISRPDLSPQTIKIPVTTTQLAPTILQLMGLSPFSLQAVLMEKTMVLPGFEPVQLSANPLTNPSKLSSVIYRAAAAQFQISEGVMQTFVTQTSSNLTNWTPLATNSVVISGSASISDNTATNSAARFYRAVQTQ